MEITAKDLSRLIELNKKKAELEFKKSVFGEDDDSIKHVSSNQAELAAKVRAASIELVIPNQNLLDELGKQLGSFPPDSIREGLKVRDGKAYSVLRERGLIVKRNHENRLEIAKLSIAAAKASQPEREAVAAAVRSGSISAPIILSSLDEQSVRRIARFLRRCGLCCVSSGLEIAPSPEPGEKEIRLDVSNRSVWVSEAAKGALQENLDKIRSINATIQLRNAERQIKSFSEEEESGFAVLQKEYLELLKQQDEILREFNEEEKISIKRE